MNKNILKFNYIIKSLINSYMIFSYGCWYKKQYLIIIGDGDVGLDSKWPVYVENILVQSQHEDNQHEEGVEHGEKEYGFVSQLLQSLGDEGLNRWWF